jgi:mono/diheme cytochrome c family protein
MCHGTDAAGKPAAKIPSLVSDDAKNLSDDNLAKDITEKAKHPAAVKSLTPDQVKMVVSYVRSLQK